MDEVMEQPNQSKYVILFGSSYIILMNLYGWLYYNLVASVSSLKNCFEIKVMHQYYIIFCLLYMVFQRASIDQRFRIAFLHSM
jgi:hypothetical protein